MSQYFLKTTFSTHVNVLIYLGLLAHVEYNNIYSIFIYAVTYDINVCDYSNIRI